MTKAVPVHPFDRTTKPISKNDLDHAGKYSWATAVAHSENGRLEAGPLARQLVAGGTHGESWHMADPLVLDMYRKIGGASVALRHFARMHEGVKIYREIERVLRELRLNDEWYIKPTERGRPRLGRDGSDPRRACAIGSRCRAARSRTIR